MNFQRKCMLVSAATHASLLLLLTGAGFVRSVTPPSPTDDLPILSFIPDILVDQPVVGGGEPPVGRSPEPAAPLPATPPAPKPTPPTKAPEPVEPPPPKPAPVEKQAPKKPEPEPLPPSETGTKPPPKKHVVQPNLSPVVKQAPETKQPTKEEREAAAAAEAAAQAQRIAQVMRSRINTAVSGISGRLSSSTSVTMPGGTGSGGASYASYSLYVKSLYQWAWRPPTELTDDSATATARIVIARDGSIISARIEIPSKVPSLDKSVRAALDRVTTIGRPFPEGAKDDQRTFLIDFNLKAKQFT